MMDLATHQLTLISCHRRFPSWNLCGCDRNGRCQRRAGGPGECGGDGNALVRDFQNLEVKDLLPNLPLCGQIAVGISVTEKQDKKKNPYFLGKKK